MENDFTPGDVGINSSCRPALLFGRKQKIQAFTLAEVLITLTIIGVVAAVKVPTLVKKTGNQEYVTRLQKAYSVLSQATDEIMYENGSNAVIWAKDANSVYSLYTDHLRTSKKCGGGTGCIKQTIVRLNSKSSDTNFDAESAKNYKFILADGMQVIIWFKSPTCSSEWTGRYTNVCARIFVDINGEKKPNMYGRDFFEFNLKSDGLHLAGCDNGYDYSDDCTRWVGGLGCTCKVLTEGEMNY